MSEGRDKVGESDLTDLRFRGLGIKVGEVGGSGMYIPTFRLRPYPTGTPKQRGFSVPE